MTSLIDITKPESVNATTASVRANFEAAKNEIEALQLPVSNARLVNDSITIGSSVIPLGTTTTAIAGLSQLEIGAIVISDTTGIDQGFLTGATIMPVGTTADRPTGSVGAYRMNTTTNEPEWFDPVTNSWLAFRVVKYTIDYLVIAGGGGGSMGGGGAGGYITGSALIESNTAFTIQIGAGGATQANPRNFAGYDGNASALGLIPSAVGGGGGGAYGDGGVAVRDGRPGGSGGGGGGLFTDQTYTPGGAGTTGQGFAGGYSADLVNGTAGGGGGAGAVGINGSNNGHGGSGLESSLSGSAVMRGGGGGGGASVSGLAGSGGSGGGGNGGKYDVSNSSSGTLNTGGGGGGGNPSPNGNGGSSGGSGIVIIRYAGPQRATGGTVTSTTDYTIHTFTTSSAYNS